MHFGYPAPHQRRDCYWQLSQTPSSGEQSPPTNCIGRASSSPGVRSLYGQSVSESAVQWEQPRAVMWQGFAVGIGRLTPGVC